MNKEERTSLYVHATRLNTFLQHNQLVQAHAIVQKLEASLQRIIERDCGTGSPPKAEDHPLWKAFRGTVRAKSRILSGLASDARLESENLLSIL